MNQESVLIVEDNDILRDGLRDILSSEGYTVMTAAHGLEALERMKTLCPDLILSDIAMPKMDGYQFFREVRSHPDWLTIPFIFITARGEKQDVLLGKNLGAEDYLIKPLTREELLTAVNARLVRSQEIRVAQLQRAYETSLTVLANAIDVRDVYTRGHVERVTAYSLVLADELGLPDHYREQLRFGAILHDIGKIIIRESTLFKSDDLDDVEWGEIYIHPVTGSEMIKDIPYLSPAMPVVRHHHERWDGRGYPDGLAGEDIPLAARIVFVADSFDAMTTLRPYHPPKTFEQAYREILEEGGKQYDPSVVQAFAQAWADGKIHAMRSEWDAMHGLSPNSE